MTTQPIRFAAAARESQAVFRAAMQALARPGELHALPEVAPFAVERARSAFALLAALADHEVCIAVTGGRADDAIAARLATGSRLVEPEVAEYVLALSDDAALPALLDRGTIETPEHGATLICAVEALGDEGTLVLSLQGPGVPGASRARVTGISRETFAARSAACESYPMGIDMFLVDRRGLCIGLPRTTVVRVED